MNKNIHVCLVSNQTIPNILGLLELTPAPDKIIFITTEKMEQLKITEAILNTIHLKKLTAQHERIIVNQDCLQDCLMQLSKLTFDKDDTIIVNITGGNKLMSLAAYNVFSNNKTAKIFYMPLPKNEFNDISQHSECNNPVPCNIKLNIKEYVTAYGVSINNNYNNANNRAKQNKKLAKFIIDNYNKLEGLLNVFYQEIGKKRDEKKPFNCQISYDLGQESETELNFLKKLNFSVAQNENHIKAYKKIDKYEARFLTGDWLSDYCFNVIELLVDDCATGIQLRSSKGTENEFDVLFTKDNALYIIECKSLQQKADKKTDILYKTYSLQQEFGLKVKGFLVSTARQNLLDKQNNKDFRPSLIARAKACNTEIIHPDKIKDLSTWLASKLKIK